MYQDLGRSKKTDICQLTDSRLLKEVFGQDHSRKMKMEVCEKYQIHDRYM